MTLLAPPDRATNRAPPALELVLRLALVASVLLGLAGLAVVWSWGAALELELGPGYWLLLAGLAATAAAGSAALATRRGSPGGPAMFLRLAFTLAAAAHLALLLLFPGFREPYVAGALGLAAGLFALLVLLVPRVPRSFQGPLRALELASFSLALCLCLAEVLLRVFAALFHPPILAETSDAAEWIRANRLRPSQLHLGFPANARGFYDRDLPAERAGPLVAVIGDSFGIGTVAHALHYTSIAEKELAPAEFYNVGVAGAGPAHYLTLLEEEVLPLRPDAIVLALFIGNDLEFELPAAGPRHLLGWLGDRQESFLARFVLRLRGLSAERELAAEHGDLAPAEPAARGTAIVGNGVVPPDELATVFPWFADPLLERPSFSPAGFLKIERERVLAVTRPVETYACFPWLERIQAAARGIPLLVLLIPDEFQVEDDVWAEATAGLHEELSRELPQALVARFCRERGLAVLDLLPALQAVPPMADGRRHVYALRDTHWNARGNEVAGRELARAVRELLGR